MTLRLRTFVLLVALLSGSCGPPRSSLPDKTPAPAKPISVDWVDPAFSATLGGGWSVRSCAVAPPVLCVDEAGRPAGRVQLKDIPSLGEEKTTSAHQIQAVLAGRINSLYQFKIGRWPSACGEAYKVTSERPPKVAMGELDAMKYELSGSAGQQTVERVMGYWSFRSGIETVIEARAASPAGCQAEPLGQLHDVPGGAEPTFKPEALVRFEPYLDRMVAGSKLPPPTRFTGEGKSPG